MPLHASSMKFTISIAGDLSIAADSVGAGAGPARILVATFGLPAVSNQYGHPPPTPRACPPLPRRRTSARPALYSRVRLAPRPRRDPERRHDLAGRSSDPLAKSPSRRVGSVHRRHTTLLDQLRHERRPPGLVRRAQSASRVAVEVLVKQHEISPMWIGLKSLRASV